MLLISGCAEVPPRKTPAPIVNSTSNRALPDPGEAPRVNVNPATQNSKLLMQTEVSKYNPLIGSNVSIRPPVNAEPPQAAPPAMIYPAKDISGNTQLANISPPSSQDFYQPGDESIGIGTRTASDDPGTTLKRYESTAPSAPTPAYGRAVTTLLAIADREQTAGKFGTAALQVERAIDLEPRNASLWRRLAELRLAQGELESAEQAARTSNDLAGGNLPLQRINWQLISEVRFELGDAAGGDQAARMAAELF